MKIELKSIIRAINAQKSDFNSLEWANIIINGVYFDSRKVKPGGLFVAIKGHSYDGNDYIDDAIANGAIAVIVKTESFDEERVTSSGVPVFEVEDTRLALARGAAAFYGEPASKLRNIAITGTNGKTTTGRLLNQIFSAAGVNTAVFTTTGINIVAEEIDAKLTTEEAPVIQNYLAQAVNRGATVAIVEASSHGIELKRIAAIPFDIAVFTNLSLDHTDFHNDMESYYRAKRELFYGLEPGAKALVNIDDEYGRRLHSELTNRELDIYSFSLVEQEADFYAERQNDGKSFVVEYEDGRVLVETSLPGKFNVYNTLAAFAVAVLSGIDAEVCVDALRCAKAPAGRMDVISVRDDFDIVIDYAHTPAGMELVLDELRGGVNGKAGSGAYLIVVFGCTGDRDKDKRPIMGEIAARLSNFTIITSDDLYYEDPMSIAKEVEAGLLNAKAMPGVNYVIELDRGKAMRTAMKIAVEVETSAKYDKIIVAVLGKGHEKYIKVKGELIPFSDFEEVERIISELKPNAEI